MTQLDAAWWEDRATVAEGWQERALERAHVLLRIAERARRASSIWRAGLWFSCWRRTITLANKYRDVAENARRMAGQHRARRGAA